MTLTITPRTVHKYITKEEFDQEGKDDPRVKGEISLLVDLLLPLKENEGIKFLIDDSDYTALLWKKRLSSAARNIWKLNRDSGLKVKFNYTSKITQDKQGNFWFSILREAE